MYALLAVDIAGRDLSRNLSRPTPRLLFPVCQPGTTSPASSPSPPAKRRRRLLVREGGDAGAEVVGPAARRDGLRLQLHLRLETLPRRLMEQALRAAERAGRSLRQLAREGVRGGRELPVRHDARDEPPL